MFARIALWLFVIFVCLDIGAGLYETRVTVPMWKTAFVDHVPDAETFVRVEPNAGLRFWIFVTPTLGLLALIAFLTGLRTSGPQRPWRLFASGLEVIMVVFTLAYMVPHLQPIINPGHGGLTPDQLAAQTQSWIALNWGRACVTTVTFLSALKALELSGREPRYEEIVARSFSLGSK